MIGKELPPARGPRSTARKSTMLKTLRTLALILLPIPALAQETMLVVQKGDDSVGLYDAGDGTLLVRIAVGTKPHEVVLSADQKLAYVTNYGIDRWTETVEGGRSIAIVDLAPGVSRVRLTWGRSAGRTGSPAAARAGSTSPATSPRRSWSSTRRRGASSVTSTSDSRCRTWWSSRRTNKRPTRPTPARAASPRLRCRKVRSWLRSRSAASPWALL